MDSRNDGGQAFPVSWVSENWEGEKSSGVQPGMTLRDYFAAAALASLSSGRYGPGVIINEGEMAEDAYAIADAMLKARESK